MVIRNGIFGFKYMAENFDFDRMIQYGTEQLNNKDVIIPNPEYKVSTYNQPLAITSFFKSG